MELLRRLKDSEYPDDYLLSRIQGRRAGLISDWTPLLSAETPFAYLSSSSYRGVFKELSEQGIQRELAREYLWVYAGMNRKIRDIFSAFFFYAELRAIYICLRHIRGGMSSGIGAILSLSLLSDRFKDILLTARDASSAVVRMEGALSRVSAGYAGIADIYSEKGPEIFERDLTIRYLAAMPGSRLHPLLKDFFLRIVDARNIIAIVKVINLKPRQSPSFVPGGSLSESVIREAIEKKDLGNVLRLAGIRGAGQAGQDIEKRLYEDITAHLRRRGRVPLDLGLLLDYLWRLSVEAMNLSLLSYGRQLQRDLISRELVL